jgi:tight adherence protein C
MGGLNVEALLWVITIILWVVLFVAGHFARMKRMQEQSAYPHVNGIGAGLERQLRQAGLSSTLLGKMQYWAAKLFCICSLIVFSLVIFSIRSEEAPTLGILIPAVLGFFLPDIWLARARRKRMVKIRASLSFYLDLVVALLRAGLPVHRAMFKAAHDGFADPHPLADEVLRVEGEIQAGKERGTAFYALADRTGVQELRTLAASVHVALKQGASIEGTLDAQAEVMRERRREEALKRVNASASYSVLPVFLCGIPIFAVVVYFPAFLEIVETLSNLRIF